MLRSDLRLKLSMIASTKLILFLWHCFKILFWVFYDGIFLVMRFYPIYTSKKKVYFSLNLYRGYVLNLGGGWIRSFKRYSTHIPHKLNENKVLHWAEKKSFEKKVR